MRPGWQLLAAVTAIALVGAAGCGDESADTGAVVTVGAEMAVRDATAEVVVTVVGAKSDGSDTVERERRFSGGELSFPLRAGITPKGGDASRVFGALAVAYDDADQVVAHASVISTYMGGKVAWYHLQLRTVCGPSVSCEPLGDGTPTGCCDGACVPVARDPRAHPAWEGQPSRVPAGARVCRGDVPPVDGGTDAGDAGVEPFGPPSSIAAGDTMGAAHTCATSAAGRVACWGRNDQGQLGDGTTTGREVPVYAELSGTATQLALGGVHTCAHVETGDVYCWGANGRGQLGNERVGAVSNVPVAVDAIPSAEAIGVGGRHSCAVVSGGEVWCWGRNDRGQLGRGTNSEQEDPAVVDSSEMFEEVCGGELFTCGRTMEGAVSCWGANGAGQLGDGTGTQSSTPVPTSVTTARQIDCGAAHACAVVEGGSILCWGANNAGQLGDGSRMQRTSPVEVSGLPTQARRVAAGGAHTCAILDDGRAYCWGANGRGQLGDDVSNPSTSPVMVNDLLDPVGVAAGLNHSCAITDTNASCWGANDDGQLGNGGSAGGFERSPVELP